jgi:cytochrome c553
VTRGLLGMRRTRVFALGLALAGCGEAPSRTDAAFSANGRLVALSGGGGGAANACIACHGLNGEGDGDAAPRLAGLDAGYLLKQLEDYAAGLRKDDTMKSIAARLSPAARVRVAAYYAGLAPRVTAVSDRPAPPAFAGCVDCHGPSGEGVGGGGPAIAGQPAAYVAEQLDRWRRAERRNDARGVMRVAVRTLSDAEIAGLAVWLAAQSASPRPASVAASGSAADEASEAPAASRAGRRPDPRTGA